MTAPSRRRLLGQAAGAAAVLGLSAGVPGLFVPRPARAALLPVLPAGGIDFDVVVAGMRSGTHTVEFQREGDRLEVRNHIEIVVAPLGLTLFEYHHRSVETYRGDRLIGFESETVDDDSSFTVAGHALAQGFEVSGRKGTFIAPDDVLVASYWTPAIFHREILIDPQRGKLKQQTIHGRERVVVEVDGRPVEATRYHVSGIITGAVDYDDSDRWLAATFQKKGVTVAYRRSA